MTTGQVIYEAPTPHRCETPDHEEYEAGSLFKCECGWYWMLKWKMSHHGWVRRWRRVPRTAAWRAKWKSPR